eukprot:11185469-Lingulodinium_polyedra.AAC.1
MADASSPLCCPLGKSKTPATAREHKSANRPTGTRKYPNRGNHDRSKNRRSQNWVSEERTRQTPKLQRDT